MKNRLFLILLAMSSYTYGQKTDEEKMFRARAELNFNLLVRDTANFKQVRIIDKGILVYASNVVNERSHPEFLLYWNEIKYFLYENYGNHRYDLIEWYTNKGVIEAEVPEHFTFIDIKQTLPIELEGLRVAIDPGHFAGNFHQALYEDKYLKVSQKELDKHLTEDEKKELRKYKKRIGMGTNESFLHFEASANFECAYILADTLRELGVEVHVSRDHGSSAVGVGFERWYNEDFEFDIESMVANGDIKRDDATWLITEATKKEVFNRVYKFRDFTTRISRINRFQPDITFAIHFNAEENNPRDVKGYSKLVEENYSEFFIPGSFLVGELKKQWERIEFLRLLVSSDLEESVRVAKHLAEYHVKVMKVDLVPLENDYKHLNKYSVFSGEKGVYHRNLVVTRTIHSPVVLGESFYQDSYKVFKKLIIKDYRYKGLMTSKWVYDTAMGYLESTLKWIEENKELSQK